MLVLSVRACWFNSLSLDRFAEAFLTKDFLKKSLNELILLKIRFLISAIFGTASARSYKIGVVGWLVGNAAFSETTQRIFLIFCRKLRGYKGRKVTELDFWKKFLILRYSRKSLLISQKSDTLIFFSKMALTIFLRFGRKLVLNMNFNLNETCFSEKFAISRYLASKSSKRLAKLKFLTIFSTWHH